MAITDRTEIYCDLRIYGDDFFDLLMWLDRRFHVRLNGSFKDYVPAERPLIWPLVTLFQHLGVLAQPVYRSLTLGDLVTAVMARSSN